MVPTENELALSPNTMFRVVACYTCEHLKDLQGVHFVVRGLLREIAGALFVELILL